MTYNNFRISLFQHVSRFLHLILHTNHVATSEAKPKEKKETELNNSFVNGTSFELSHIYGILWSDLRIPI